MENVHNCKAKGGLDKKLITYGRP